MSSPSNFKVLVIGGGSCGLALAQGLRKAGISYTLYERDSAEDYHNRPRDWGTLIHWAQEYLPKCLPQGLWERRAEMAVDPWYDYMSTSQFILWNAKTGEELLRPGGVDSAMRLSRRKVRLLLSEGLDIEYSKKLVGVESHGDEVTAHFQDGTKATGNFLVGCDGGHSKVREYIVGPEAAKGFDSDYTMINISLYVPAETALALRAKHPINSITAHPDTHYVTLIAVLDVPYKDAPPETWKFQAHAGWRGYPRKADLDTPEKAMKQFKAVFATNVEPFHSISTAAMPETQILPVDDGWNFKPLGNFNWDNHGGKVTLAGDAAHSMLPSRGQGLNNALMDSAGILDLVEKVGAGKESLEEAVGKYENEMRPRAAKEVDLTLEVMLKLTSGDLWSGPLFTLGIKRAEAGVNGDGK